MSWKACLTAALTVRHGGLAHIAANECPYHMEVGQQVHAFYYLWYGTPTVDNRWIHWNHHVLPHWTATVRQRYPEASFLPPDDIHAAFYPSRGLYSSSDELAVEDHFVDMKEHGIGVAVISWWGRPSVSKGDSQGVVTEGTTEMVLRVAEHTGIKIALHLEPYEGRSAASVRDDLQYLSDIYHLPPQEWQRLFKVGGDLSVRDTSLDGYVMGLWLEPQHGTELAHGGFDGAYTYFATDGFSYGSSITHWSTMAATSRAAGLSLSLSVAPGYDDSKIRPWNAQNTRSRDGGRYYDRMWEAALAVNSGHGPDFVSITTYNEWGEGTQIEDAVPRRIDVEYLASVGRALNRTTRQALGIPDVYSDYTDTGGPGAYMSRTKEHALKWTQKREVSNAAVASDSLSDRFHVSADAESSPEVQAEE